MKKRKVPKSSSLLIIAATPFARVANIINALQDRAHDNDSFRAHCPVMWPTVGDVRRLRDELVRLGWKP